MMQWHRMTLLSLLALSMPAAVCAQSPSIQQTYNDAQAAFDNADWPAAIAGFTAVLATPGKPVTRSQAIIHARLAEALLAGGRGDEARAHANIAVSALSAADPLELGAALMTQGAIARYAYDMPVAIAAYTRAAQVLTPDIAMRQHVLAVAGVAQSAMVFDPTVAAAALDELLATPAVDAGLDMVSRAQIEALRGRAELNRGNPKLAAKWLDDAVRHSGGIGKSYKISQAQVAVRGDAAIAYRLLGNDEQTRKYLTWTGAGHLESIRWISSASLVPPLCAQPGDGDDVPRPDDTAVVEFAIGADGKVAGASTVYASRPGAMGLSFARAARQWRWHPASIADLNPFWRNAVRVQLRCIASPARDSVGASFYRAANNWLMSQGMSPAQIGSLWNPYADPDAAALDSGDAATIAAHFGRLEAEHGGEFADYRLDPRLERALAATAAPAEVRAVAINLQASWGNRARQNIYYARRADRMAAALPGFAAAWPQARANGWLRYETALAQEKSGALVPARAGYTQLLALAPTALPADDVIRDVATLHLAALEAHAGQQTVADTRIKASGISAEQCALFDVQPTAINAKVAGSDFPAEVNRWQFEGTVGVAFDIDRDGSVKHVRTVLAYPPFIFNDATERTIGRFQYLPPVIEGTAAGCAGRTERVSFIRPKLR